MPRKVWHSLPEYQTFRAMMEAGSTAAAATRLGLSQSAVSRSLASLEARIGTVLFEREAGRLRPSAAGAALNARLDPLFAALDQLEGPPEPGAETLRVIAPPSYVTPFLTGQMGGFLKPRPDARISLEFGTSEDVILGVRAGRFDMGLVGVEPTRAGTRLQPLVRSVAVCVMAPEHPLAGRTEIAPDDLHEAAMIAIAYRHRRRGQLDQLLMSHGVRPHIVAEVSSSAAAADLARAGLGLAVINPFPTALPDTNPGLVFRPFPEAPAYQSYFLTPDSRPVTRLARQFIQHVRLHLPPSPFSTLV